MRTDLYWRVKNTLENDLVLIPGVAATGTNKTLKQVIRALALGGGYDDRRVGELFAESEEVSGVPEEGYDPEQLCYIPCSDPLAHLVEEFVGEVKQAYHPRAVRTGKHDFYLFFADLHRIDNWQSQF